MGSKILHSRKKGKLQRGAWRTSLDAEQREGTLRDNVAAVLANDGDGDEDALEAIILAGGWRARTGLMGSAGGEVQEMPGVIKKD